MGIGLKYSPQKGLNQVQENTPNNVLEGNFTFPGNVNFTGTVSGAAGGGGGSVYGLFSGTGEISAAYQLIQPENEIVIDTLNLGPGSLLLDSGYYSSVVSALFFIREESEGSDPAVIVSNTEFIDSGEGFVLKGWSFTYDQETRQLSFRAGRNTGDIPFTTVSYSVPQFLIGKLIFAQVFMEYYNDFIRLTLFVNGYEVGTQEVLVEGGIPTGIYYPPDDTTRFTIGNSTNLQQEGVCVVAVSIARGQVYDREHQALFAMAYDNLNFGSRFATTQEYTPREFIWNTPQDRSLSLTWAPEVYNEGENVSSLVTAATLRKYSFLDIGEGGYELIEVENLDDAENIYRLCHNQWL